MNIVLPEENVIFEDEETIMVLSLNPISKGHVIIKPKEKYRNIDELPESLLKKILQLTQCYIRILKRKYSPMGYSIMQNGGEFNDIDQFHLHVFLRNNSEEFYWIYANELDNSATKFQQIKQDLESELLKLINK